MWRVALKDIQNIRRHEEKHFKLGDAMLHERSNEGVILVQFKELKEDVFQFLGEIALDGWHDVGGRKGNQLEQKMILLVLKEVGEVGLDIGEHLCVHHSKKFVV